MAGSDRGRCRGQKCPSSTKLIIFKAASRAICPSSINETSRRRLTSSTSVVNPNVVSHAGQMTLSTEQRHQLQADEDSKGVSISADFVWWCSTRSAP